MSRIYRNMTQMIGNTPLLDLERFAQRRGVSARILAKLERQNPCGSAGDRAALAIIREAERSRKLSPGGMIIEPTDGRAGISLAAIAVVLGYGAVMIMPEGTGGELCLPLSAYGAEVIYTPAAEGPAGALKMAEDIHSLIPGSVIIRQHESEANSPAHYDSTGPEIWRDSAGCVDIFVAGPGAEGMIVGAGRYLKEQNPSIKIVAVKRETPPPRSGGKSGQGAGSAASSGAGREALGELICDEAVTVSDACALEEMKLLARTEGILCGLSSGAALHAAVISAKRPENNYNMIAVVLPDAGERYPGPAFG